MLITSLKRKGNKVIIAFDEGPDLIVNYEIAIKSGLRRDEELSEENKNNIIKQSELLFIKNSAFRFLSRRLHSIYELKIKLQKKKYAHDLIELVLEQLIEGKYLDDIQFANTYFEEKLFKKKCGIQKIKSDLIRKGIERDIIIEIENKFQNDPVNLENAITLARKKINSLKHNNLSTKKIEEKIYMFLKRKGFSFEIVQMAIKEVHENIKR